MILLQATLIIIVFSFLYKENIFYRIVEFLTISITSSVLIVTAWRNIEKWSFRKILGGDYIFILGTILGILLYARYIKKYSFLSRYGISVMVGVSLGLSITTTLQTQIIDQIIATSELSLVGVPTFTAISNLILVVVVMSIVTYFTYTFWGNRGSTSARAQSSSTVITSGVDIIVKGGRYSLMLAFGAILGNMVMDRMTDVIYTIRTLLGIFGIAQF